MRSTRDRGGQVTAGAFAPQALRAMGAEVIEMDCELDHTFPRYNPNPEDMKMLHAMRVDGTRGMTVFYDTCLSTLYPPGEHPASLALARPPPAWRP